jgi:hypothetical protein
MHASLDLEYSPSTVFFTWAGFDEMDEVSGSGSAELLDDGSIEQASDQGRNQYDDCWSYAVEGSDVGVGSEASVCFIADEVVYTSIVAE